MPDDTQLRDHLREALANAYDRGMVDAHASLQEVINTLSNSLAGVHRDVRAALADQETTCRYHGDNFGFLGWQWDEPRCESCRPPWRTVRALKGLDA